MAKGCQGLSEIPKNMTTYPCLVDLSELQEVSTALDDDGKIAGCILKFKNGNSIWVANDFEEVMEIFTEFFSQKSYFKFN